MTAPKDITAGKLSEFQRNVLQRLSNGDSMTQRINLMFCDKASRYVRVFRNDFTVVSQSTLSALLRKGYLGVGYIITDAGRAALKESK